MKLFQHSNVCSNRDCVEHIFGSPPPAVAPELYGQGTDDSQLRVFLLEEALRQKRCNRKVRRVCAWGMGVAAAIFVAGLIVIIATGQEPSVWFSVAVSVIGVPSGMLYLIVRSA